MELNGTIHKIMETKEYGSNGFKKREFVIDTGGEYPQLILLAATQDRCTELDSLQVGDYVDCAINVRGREWTSPDGKVMYFNTLEVWRFNNTDQQGATKHTPPPTDTMEELEKVEDLEDDDLPF